MLVGEPGTRKTSAMNVVTRLAGKAGYTNFAKGKTSKEKFLEDMATGFLHAKQLKKKFSADSLHTQSQSDLLEDMLAGLGDVIDKPECAIVADEFTNYIGIHNVEFASMLSELWDYQGPYEHRVRNSKSIVVCDPTISILSGNTQSSLALAFAPEMMGQGLMSRLLFIHSEESGKQLPFPEAPDEELEKHLVEAMFTIRTSLQGEMKFVGSAKEYMAHVYRNHPKIPDHRFKFYQNRRFTHLLKLCMCMAAMDTRMTITEEDCLYANTVLAQAEIAMPKALAEYGNTKYSTVSGKIVNLLTENLPSTT